VLTDLQKRKLTALFNADDVNKDGFLQQDDFERIAELYAQTRGWQPGTPGSDALHATFRQIWNGLREFADRNRDDRVSRDEMLQSFDQMLRDHPELVQGWSDLVFTTLDADGDGEISPQEYRQLLATAQIDASVADELFPRLDTNGDGHISKEEFDKLFGDFFMSDDQNAPGNWLWGPF
jgi:hypothetical protein